MTASRQAAEQKVLREVVLDQLTTGETRAYRMWLPPLTDPTPVNELVERDHQRRPLRFGLGIMDEPRRHRQEVWGVDVSAAGGNIAIGGAPQTGKSTFLQTLMMSAAATHSPRDVQFYCVDLGGGGLLYLEDLPHVGGVATRAEPDRVNRVVAEVKAVQRQRERTFKELRVGSIAGYRQMRDDPNNPAAADPFGDVFLVIDGWPAFVAEFPDLEPVVQDLAGQGLAFGVHVIISTPRWTELKSRVRDYLGTKIEFRLGDVNETQIDRITREIPANRPGRAISMEKHHLMMGCPASTVCTVPPTWCPPSRRPSRRSRRSTRCGPRRCGCCPNGCTCTSSTRTRPDRIPTTAPGGGFRSACASPISASPTTRCR